MTSPKVLNERCCKKLSFCIYRLVSQTFLSVILEPSCKVIKEMLFRIFLSSVDHLPSRSAYIFYENPWMFVPSPQCIAIPYTLCIWIFPLWPPDSVSPGSILRFCRLYTPFLSALYSVSLGFILRFCRLIYSVSLGSYSVSVASFTRFPYSSTHFLYGNAPFVLHLEKYHPSFVLPLSPHPFRSPFPVSRCAPFFSCPAIPIPLCPSIQLPPLFSPATPRH